MLNDDHKNALRDARSAVSAYSRNPSDSNAAKVQFVMETEKDRKQAIWQQHFEMWLRTQ